MKTKLLSLTSVLFAMTGLQAQDLQIHKTNGTVITIPLNSIDSITFIEEGGTFVCGSSTVTWQGQDYNTVQIGDQCWMKENLNWNTGSSWCHYDDPDNCDTYGRLYTWETIMNGASSSNSVPSGVQGICPTGWHIPSDVEWCIVTKVIDPSVHCDSTGWSGADAGTKMKSTTGWNYNGNGTNESGFTALPAGYRESSLGFGGLGSYASFWSSTEFTSFNALRRVLYSDHANVGRFDWYKGSGYSVRCVRD